MNIFKNILLKNKDIWCFQDLTIDMLDCIVTKVLSITTLKQHIDKLIFVRNLMDFCIFKSNFVFLN